ncbi:hypothetical protein GW17_00021282 [Ensete ventricosum]|nr:hypothetical protein GW17_00021282 [Ensete ventricosum]
MLVELLVMFVFKVVPHVDGDDDDDDDDAVIIGESTSDYKNKEAVRSDKSCPEQLNLDILLDDFMSSSANNYSEHVAPLDNLKSYEAGQLDLKYYDDVEYDYAYDDDYDYEYDAEDIDNDSDLNLAAKFDDLDLPTGIELTVPWLEVPSTKELRKNKDKMVIEDEINVKYRSFKQFDTVQDYEDHYFSRPDLLKTIPSTKRVSNTKHFYATFCSKCCANFS